MHTVTQQDDNSLPPPDVTPYFRERARLEEAAAERGLPFEAWAA